MDKAVGSILVTNKLMFVINVESAFVMNIG